MIKNCLYATFYCQICWFAIRCLENCLFQVAAAKWSWWRTWFDTGMPRNACGANPNISAKYFLRTHQWSRLLREGMNRLYVTSIGGWSLRGFGDVSKGKVKHPSMIDCWVLSGYVFVRYMIFEKNRLDYRCYTRFMGMATSPVPQTFIVTKCHIQKWTTAVLLE